MWEKLLIPDGKIFWNRSILKFLDDIIIKENPNAVFITGTPFSSFLLTENKTKI